MYGGYNTGRRRITKGLLFNQFQAIMTSGMASSRHCEASGPPTYALKRKMCLSQKQITNPILDNQSFPGWKIALILSLIAGGLFVIMLIVIYFVRTYKAVDKPSPNQEQNESMTPLAGRVVPRKPEYRAPPPTTRAAPPPPTPYRIQLPSSNHSTFNDHHNWEA